METLEFEPLMPSEGEAGLEELVVTLVARANQLAGQLHPVVRASIGDLVRSMNCYYSNLIEGHNTHPRDIDRALNDEYSKDPKRRDLQIEARAHIEVQRIIDSGNDPKTATTSEHYLRWVHYEFCRRLPPELLVAQSPGGRSEIVVPGELRTGDVSVGRHLAPSAEKLPRLLQRYEQAYDPNGLSATRRIIAAAAAHHRFAWMHPFYDGNGRVARLVSHATLLRCGVGSSLWSISRGLAKTVERYKTTLMLADEPRHGDLDGRGALSTLRLREFCAYFLETCIDQVNFMESLLQPSELLRRLKLYVDDEISANRLPKGSLQLLREALLAGELERGRAADLTGYQVRRGREILAHLIKAGLLSSQGPRVPVRLGFPLDVVERLFPLLFPSTSPEPVS
jgi:Fic family protein